VATSAYITVDDAFSDTVNLGFSFSFYGNTYTKCVVGANGNISFNDSLATQYDPWPINDTLLGNTSLYNSICGPFADMDIVYGGQIAYFTYGTAPNRQFVVSYCHDAMYTSALCPGDYTTTQIILYESSNTIEVHLAHNSACTAWNGGHAIIGVQNATGTAATAAPGRDYPAVWLATNEAWRFTPDATESSYAVDSISYAPVPYYTTYWYDSVSGTFLGTGDSITLTPTAPTVYVAYAMSCNDADSTGLDTAGSGHIELYPVGHIPPAGVNILPSLQNVAIYPNPAHNELSILADQVINTVTVTNLLGQTEISLQTNQKHVNVNTSALAPGVYFINLNGLVMKRFIKE
jgi:hypothetical protein